MTPGYSRQTVYFGLALVSLASDYKWPTFGLINDRKVRPTKYYVLMRQLLACVDVSKSDFGLQRTAKLY